MTWLPVVAGLLWVFVTGFIEDTYSTEPVATPLTDTVPWPTTFNLGRAATAAEIKSWDIDVSPNGRGLPAGQGTAITGKIVYQTKCAACHGKTGEAEAGVKLPAPVLVSDTVFVGRKTNTIGNYWPYATTIFDYVRRAMPYHAPQSLTNNEVYAVTAYLLNANRIVKADAVINANTLPRVVMPARKYYVDDDRKGGAEVK
ncbi:cytochrome c [Mucilaginibacter roseus]|uniref:Cytochrome c n=1 Tax=Mucilaginibacter roseus TaxID=1528868 RepID=A0ABS8U6A2_9SPHI|nr:cytochrome c [Mucilaginibacter roseus]MCD8742147.1 cytochrome c [Mucilaginibacter roseus]